MDEFDRLNPFDDEFRPDAETPPPSPSPTPPTPPLAEESDGDGDGEGGEEGEETTTRKKVGAPGQTPQPKMKAPRGAKSKPTPLAIGPNLEPLAPTPFS